MLISKSLGIYFVLFLYSIGRLTFLPHFYASPCPSWSTVVRIRLVPGDLACDLFRSGKNDLLALIFLKVFHYINVVLELEIILTLGYTSKLLHQKTCFFAITNNYLLKFIFAFFFFTVFSLLWFLDFLRLNF